ncbi:MAG: GNAT family N-acetyltransferase [Lachnospiraceae bacterium]|nr:GNAT family N-acetyltransferase [Lachnospiraceae bacterium]
MLKPMTIRHYPALQALWQSIKAFSINSIDDSREGIAAFLTRNPKTSVVCEQNGEIIGSILCGHDGRRGYFYHVCVSEDSRMQGIGKAMVDYCIEALKKENITKVSLLTFTHNRLGNTFWEKLGFTKRNDINLYDYLLNPENETTINQ